VAPTRHVIKPRPAVRAFGLAALLAVAGAALAVGASASGWTVVLTALGVLLLGLGVALLAAALVAAVRQTVTIELDDAGYRVVEPGGGVRTGEWATVTKVTGAPGRLTLHSGEDQRVHLLAPPGAQEALDELAADIGRHLDHQRGFRTLE